MTLGMKIFLVILLTLCEGKPDPDPDPCSPIDEYSIKLPGKAEALAGSCVLVPCKFILPQNCKINSSKSIRGRWLKGEEEKTKTVFDTNKEFERIKMPGDLYQQNCTSAFYNVESSDADKYYFRVENSALKYTYVMTPLNLTVKDSPASPHVSGPSEVAEGTSVNVTCTAAAPCPCQPPNITWSLHTGDITTHIQDEGDGRRNLTSFLTFTASRSHHGSNIFCTVSYITQKQNSVEKNSTLHTLKVQFSPEVVEASVSPSGAVAEGSNVTLTCNSSEANPPVHNYTWFRDTQTSPVGSGPNITFNVSSSHAGLYYCRAEHLRGGKESNRVELKVAENSSISLMYMMAAGGCLGVLLLCVVTGFVLRIKKSKATEQDKQNPIHQDSDVRDQDGPAHTNAPNPTKDQQEEIHYGEISFSRPPLRDRSEGTGQKGLGLAQESEYAEVLLSGRDCQARYQKAPETEELYAQVKRK